MSSPTGPAGGDLFGNYPDPGVTGLADVIAESATALVIAQTALAEASGALATITPWLGLSKGNGTLDSTGIYAFTTNGNVTEVITSWKDAAGTGQLFVTSLGSNNWTITSSAGASDGYMAIRWIAL